MYSYSGSVRPGGSSATGYSFSRNRSVCVRFLYNNCPHSDMTCPYSHNKDDAVLCQAWKGGLCHLNRCFGRHYYLEKDRVPHRREPLRELTTNTEFSSPLVVKVKTLTEKHRREEVDLETGRRRSWVEMENKELIDITGEASPVPPPKKAKGVDENGALIKKKVAEEEAMKKKMVEEEAMKKKVAEEEAMKRKVAKEEQMNKKVAEEEQMKKKVAEEEAMTKKVAEAMKKKIIESNERIRGEVGKKNGNKCSGCGREFKGERGVKAHLSHPWNKCGKSSTNAPQDGLPAASANAELDGTVYVISDDES